MTDDTSQLAPAGFKPRALLAGLILVPLAVIAVVVAWDSPGSTWQQLSTGGTESWVTSGTAGFVLLLWLVLHLAMRRHRLELDAERLRISTSFYTRTVPLSEILLDKARVVSLEERTEFKPLLKTNGYALPGFHSGHFRLHNNDSAFVAMAGGPRVLWLPTATGKSLLLQPRRPEALLERLHELARPGYPR